MQSVQDDNTDRSRADRSITARLGPYTVREGLRRDNPGWPVYLVYKGERLIGRQFSRPSLSDCEWLDRERVVYALAEQSKRDFRKHSRHIGQFSRRGRPRKADAERELAEAMAA